MVDYAARQLLESRAELLERLGRRHAPETRPRIELPLDAVSVLAPGHNRPGTLDKEGSSEGQRLQQRIDALRSLLESGGGGDGLRESFGHELFPNRVFVSTPRGDVMDLPQGATAVDFAFNVHTDAGHCCRGAKVAGRGVKVDRRECRNILTLGKEDRDRLIEVDWGSAARSRWNVDIAVQACQRPDLLRDATNVLAEDGIDVICADLNPSVEPPDARIEMTVQIPDLAPRNSALQRLVQLPNGLDAYQPSAG